MLLANFNLANTCAPHATLLRTIMCAITHARARVVGGINFGDSVKNSPICQIKIPRKSFQLYGTRASCTLSLGCTLSLIENILVESVTICQQAYPINLPLLMLVNFAVLCVY